MCYKNSVTVLQKLYKNITKMLHTEPIQSTD